MFGSGIQSQDSAENTAPSEQRCGTQVSWNPIRYQLSLWGTGLCGQSGKKTFTDIVGIIHRTLNLGTV